MSTATHGRRGRIAASRQTSSDGAAAETMRLVLALWALVHGRAELGTTQGNCPRRQPHKLPTHPHNTEAQAKSPQRQVVDQSRHGLTDP